MNKTNHTELLKSQTNVEENSNKANCSKQLTYNEPYRDTDIWIRGHEESGYFATLGQFVISKHKETIHEIVHMLDNKDYEIILAIIDSMIHWDKFEPSSLTRTEIEIPNQKK